MPRTCDSAHFDDGAPRKGRVRRDDDTSTQKSYEVKKLTQTRLDKGERQYLVRWRGWGLAHDEWVEEKELRRTAPLCLREFLAGSISQKRKRLRSDMRQSMPSVQYTAEDQRTMCKGCCKAVDNAEICYRVPYLDDYGQHRSDSGYAVSEGIIEP